MVILVGTCPDGLPNKLISAILQAITGIGELEWDHKQSSEVPVLQTTYLGTFLVRQ